MYNKVWNINCVEFIDKRNLMIEENKNPRRVGEDFLIKSILSNTIQGSIEGLYYGSYVAIFLKLFP